MKQKTKKRLITYTLIAVWLVGCYFIGQKTHSQAIENNVEKSESVTTEVNNEQDNKEAKDEINTAIPVAFINDKSVSTEEIPWGITAGTISLEDESEAWLLTPGTGLQFESTDRITLRYSIHPWMKDISDGASLQVAYNENNEVLNVDQNWTEYNIPSTGGTVRIDALFTDNNDGDWIIIQTIIKK